MCIAPLIGGTLWSWSVEIDVFFNAYIVYAIIAIVFVIASCIAWQIPTVLNAPPDLPSSSHAPTPSSSSTPSPATPAATAATTSAAPVAAR